MMPEDLRLYILMRTDLPSMNPGKAMAQASHASNQFWKNHQDLDLAKEWAASTTGGFGTVLVLGASLEEIKSVEYTIEAFEAVNHNKIPRGMVIDPTYPYIVNREICELISPELHTNIPQKINEDNFVCFREVVTCYYVFGYAEKIKSFVSHLKLHV